MVGGQSVPDVYCDALEILATPFGLVLNLSQRAPVQGTDPAIPVAHVRMSLEHAKVMAIILRKVLKSHEDAQGAPIPLHPSVYSQMGISRDEDW